MTDITFQIGAYAKDANPRPQTHSWEEWQSILTSHERRSTKDGPYFGPYMLDSSGQRRAANLLGYTAIVLDVDKQAASIAQASAAMDKFKWASLLYTTYNSCEQLPRYRVVVPVDGLLPVVYLRAAVQSLAAWLGLAIDPASWSRSQMMYLPVCAPESTPQTYVVRGPVIPVSTLLSVLPAPTVEDKMSVKPDEWRETAVDGSESDSLPLEELRDILLNMRSMKAAFGNGVTARQIWEVDEVALTARWPSESATKIFDRSAALQALCQHAMWVCGHNHERALELIEMSSFRELYDDDYDWDRRARQALANPKFQSTDSFYVSKGARTAEAVAVVTAPAAPVATNARPAIQPGMATFTKDHLPNAATFMQCFYPGGSLARVDEEMYRWTGKVWEVVSKPELEHELTVAMSHSTPQKDVVNGTLSMLCALVHKPGLTLGDYPGKQPGRLVHFDNGILDLDSMSLSPHDPSWFSTNILPYAYTTGAGCQHWQQFLSSIFEGDDQRVQLLQEWFGYMLVRSYEHQKGMLMIGAPRSGKGTIGRILREMVGPFNFSGVSLDGFASDPVLDAISDKPVVFVGDARTVDHGSRSKVLARILEIIGQDEVSFNRKWIRKAHNSSMPCRITIAANGVPEFLDHSGALSERLLILPFNKSFAGREDPYLKDKLLQELPGICCWAIAGLQRLRAQGRFTDVAAAEVEREDMQSIQSPLHDFAALCLSFTPDAKVSTEDLYQAYVAYCIRNGQYKVGRNKLVSEMRTAFRGRIEKRPIRFDGVSKQGFTGVGLRPDADMGVTPHLVA